MRVLVRAVTSGLTLVGMIASTNAVNLTLTPGVFGFMPADDPAQLGTLIATLTSADTQDDALRFTARVYSRVYADDPNNPWRATGGLTFWYSVENIDDGVTEGRPLQGLGIPLSAPAVQIEVNQDDSPLNAAPADIAGLTGAGSSLGFVWMSDMIDLTESSAWIALYTDYTGYAQSLVGVADGTVEDIAALVPWGSNKPVPDTTTTALLLLVALAGVGGCTRWQS